MGKTTKEIGKNFEIENISSYEKAPNKNISQIKQWGDSKVIVLSPEFLKYHEAEVEDWLDISDAVLIKKEDGNGNKKG